MPNQLSTQSQLPPALVQEQQTIIQRLKTLKEETLKDTITFDPNWGKDLIVDENNINEVKEAYAYADKARKLMEVKVKEEAKVLYQWKDIIAKKSKGINLAIKNVDSYAQEEILKVYLNRMDNILSKIKEYSINVEKERQSKLRAEREEALRVAEANKRALEEATHKVLASGANPEAVKTEEQKRLAILKEQKDLALAQLEEANKKRSTVGTPSGKLQDRISYKLDIERIDKLKVLQFVLDNIEHLDLIEINSVYANKEFRPTRERPEPVKVDGLPFEMEASLITK